MSNTDQVPEPSMEEILSSIRRIISDDGDGDSSEGDASTEKPEETAAPQAEDDVKAKEPSPEKTDSPEPEAKKEPEAADPEPVEDEDDIFELTNVVEVEVEEVPSADDELDLGEIGTKIVDSGADVDDDIDFVNVDEAEPEPEPVAEVAAPAETDIADRLVSDGVGKAAAASFGDLATTLLSRGDSASTVEELIQEMLRPLLKDWLDTNLPNIVEKLVGEEIERIARRGR